MTCLSRSSNLFLILAASLATVGLLGCSSSGPTTAPDLPGTFPDHTPAEIGAHIRTPTDTLERFSAQARVNVKSPAENRSFNATIRQRRADSLFMRFSLFGFEGGRMLLTRDSVFIYDTRKHTLRVGPVAEAQRLLPAPVASNEVFENLLGIIAPNEARQWTVNADSSMYHLSSPSGNERWTVDPSRWRVVRYTRKGSDGQVTEIRSYSDFKDVQGVTLPHSVTFQRPPDNVTARIEYEEIRLNPSGLSFGLNVPSEIPRKPLQSR